MSLAQLARLIISAISSAATQTVQDIESFFTVTIAQIEYVASWFGYNGPGSPAEALQNSIDELLADVSDGFANVAAILNIVNDIQAKLNAGVPATLPNTPPPGYGGASAGESASAVWATPLDAVPFTAGFWMKSAGGWARSRGDFPSPQPVVGHAILFPAFDVVDGPVPPVNIEEVNDDLSLALPGETLLDFLQRLNPDASASYFIPGQTAVWLAAGGSISQDWYTVIGEGEFGSQRDAIHAQPRTAPVWPGLDKVTLGDAVALSNDCEVPGPLDGLLIHLTGIPSGRDGFTYGPFHSYIKIGALTFVSDNGDAEFIQALSLDSEVYSPRSMARAQSAVVRAANGVTGTATPWTIS